ncbi:MAG: aminopeptidase P family protein [Rikenellaceae bacterium]|nr:aminopeptidase P family protein [Rikenellaceae bacterium]
MFQKETYIRRRQALKKKIKKGLILLPGNVEAPANYAANTYKFLQDSTFLYFFGLDIPGIVGLIDVEADTDCLYGDDFTIDQIIWTGPQPALRELGEKVGVIGNTYTLFELQSVILKAIKQGRKIHFLPPYRSHNKMQVKNLLGVSSRALENYVSVELIRAVVSLREIKEEEEIAEIEKACETGYRMHTTAMKLCRPGINEREIAGAIEGIALRKGWGLAFTSIVSEHGEILHNPHYTNRLKPGRLLLVDAGAATDRCYNSDFTRTMPVDGVFTQKQKDIYNIVLEANNNTFRLITPGVTYQSLHLEAAKVIATGLKELNLLKGSVDDIVQNGAYALFMPHGLGHQLGLDAHDMEDLGERYVGYNDKTERSSMFGLGSLRMGRELLPGHVLTVEPGIYFIPQLIQKWQKERINAAFINYDTVADYLDFGGIRLEDNALVLKKGCRMLGKKRIPITPDEVEETMRQEAEF